MSHGPVIALIDGEHHPAAVRDVLDRLDADRGLAGVVFCGGEEKLRPGVLAAPTEHYGRVVATEEPPATSLSLLAATTTARAVVDLADEPVLAPAARLRLAALALHLGLSYESPGLSLTPPRYESLAYRGAKLAVIGTGKRSGKTAVAGHWAALLREQGANPVVVAMGRGGPREPRLAAADTTLEDLLALSVGGGHAASDYLEAAVLAGVPAIGCRRVGGGLAGEPFESNVAAAARLAVAGASAGRATGALVFDGSGACVPPVEVDRTVCVVGEREGALAGLGPYRLMRADLALVPERAGDPRLADDVAELSPRVARFALVPEPAMPLARDARVALFTAGGPGPAGLEAVVASANLARRAALAHDLERCAQERCDVYLTELKAAAIDTVAAWAIKLGASVVFLRNRPVGLDSDLDSELLRLHGQA